MPLFEIGLTASVNDIQANLSRRVSYFEVALFIVHWNKALFKFYLLSAWSNWRSLISERKSVENAFLLFSILHIAKISFRARGTMTEPYRNRISVKFLGASILLSEVLVNLIYQKPIVPDAHSKSCYNTYIARKSYTMSLYINYQTK